MSELENQIQDTFLNENKYYAPIYEGIFDENNYQLYGKSRHLENMARALPMFIWFVAKTTEEFDRDGEIWGKVFGGNALKVEDIPVPGSYSQKRRHFHRLEKNGYIKIYKAKRGLRIFVMRSKCGRIENGKTRVIKNDQSLINIDGQDKDYTNSGIANIYSRILQ
ncbi:hypothetical protein ACFL4Q_02480 [candidate division KSB1 bacterium]